MPPKTQIFITGVTGYLGGTFLAQLLKSPIVASLDITNLVRNADKAKVLESHFGVKTIVGSHDEHEKIEMLAENADIVIHFSDSDSVPVISAILKGIKNRYTKTGKAPILIHTTGMGFVMDDARGECASETIYEDTNLEQLKAVPADALHRNVDLLIVEADTAGYVRAHIVSPATIYGAPTHELVAAGISSQHSAQIPALIKAALSRGRAGMVGMGKAVFSVTHVDDVASLYIVLLESVLRDPDLSHGWNGFYYLGNDEQTWYEVSKEIGDTLVSLGRATDAEPTPFEPEELPKFLVSERFGTLVWGSNYRVREARALALGWKPKHAKGEVLKSIKPEVESLAQASL